MENASSVLFAISEKPNNLALNPFDGEMEETGDELDSGTWFLIRVSDLPSPDARGGLVAFVRETTLAGAEENDGEQSDENFLPT